MTSRNIVGVFAVVLMLAAPVLGLVCDIVCAPEAQASAHGNHHAPAQVAEHAHHGSHAAAKVQTAQAVATSDHAAGAAAQSQQVRCERPDAVVAEFQSRPATQAVQSVPVADHGDAPASVASADATSHSSPPLVVPLFKSTTVLRI